MKTVYRCMSCAWYGCEPLSERVREPDGRVTLELSCPECSYDVEDRLACVICDEAPIEDDGDGDHCGPCRERAEEIRAECGTDFRAVLVDIGRLR